MKVRGWENRLISYLNTNSKKPFKPGELDCIMFSAGALLAITQVDHAARFRGKYRTIEDGLAMLKAEGFDNHVEYVASIFEEHKNPLKVERGDLAVAIDMHGQPAIGVVQGEFIYVMGLKGIGLIPITAAVRAFKV